MHIAATPTIAIAVFLTLVMDATYMRAVPLDSPSNAPSPIAAPPMPAPAVPQWGSPPINLSASVMASLIKFKPIPAPSGSDAPPPPKPAALAGWNQLPDGAVRVKIIAVTAINQVSDAGERPYN